MDGGLAAVVEIGLHSSPSTPFMEGLTNFFIQPSMWSKDRFSMTKTTMVLIGEGFWAEIGGRRHERVRKRRKMEGNGVFLGFSAMGVAAGASGRDEDVKLGI